MSLVITGGVLAEQGLLLPGPPVSSVGLTLGPSSAETPRLLDIMGQGVLHHGGWVGGRHSRNTSCQSLGEAHTTLAASHARFCQRETSSDLRRTCFWACSGSGHPHLCPGRKWHMSPPKQAVNIKFSEASSTPARPTERDIYALEPPVPVTSAPRPTLEPKWGPHVPPPFPLCLHRIKQTSQLPTTEGACVMNHRPMHPRIQGDATPSRQGRLELSPLTRGDCHEAGRPQEDWGEPRPQGTPHGYVLTDWQSQGRAPSVMPSTDRTPCVSHCEAHSNRGLKHAHFTDKETEAADKACSFAGRRPGPRNSGGPELVLNQGTS